MFDGKTYNPKKDQSRLKKQFNAVFDLMIDGKFRTLRQIEILTKFPQTSISARLRDFRKPKFGSYKVNRRHVKKGLYEYQVIK